MNRSFLILYTVLSIIIASCATQSAPTGGPKDEDPPQLLESIPTDGQINYNSKTIVLEFDEWVALNNITKELIITPRIDQEIETKQKKTKIIIELTAPLDSNTTYTFYFREGIKDLNEGNVPENLKLTFSTGSYLDSLSLKGSVYDLFNNKKTKDISIALYDANDTSEIFSDPPLYLAKTDKKGSFILENLKRGQYKMYAYNDKNNNLTLETATEMYSFHPEIISLDTIVVSYDLPLFYLNVDSLKLQSSRPSGHYYVAKYNKYIMKYSVTPLDTTQYIYSKLQEYNKELKFYNTLINVDSTQVVITAEDSIAQVVSDTLFIRFEETKRDRDEYKVKITNETIDYDNPVLSSVITFSKPTLEINYDSLFIFIDSLTTVSLSNADLAWEKDLLSIQIHKELTPEMFLEKQIISKYMQGDTLQVIDTTMSIIKPTLVLGAATFVSVEADSSTTLTSGIKKFEKNTDTGIIRVKVNNSSTPYTIQLLSKNDEVVVEYISKEVSNHLYNFEDLKPGEYKLRALVDTNNNGIWELGNIHDNTLPEPIKFFETEDKTGVIILRANWELGPLNFNF